VLFDASDDLVEDGGVGLAIENGLRDQLLAGGCGAWLALSVRDRTAILGTIVLTSARDADAFRVLDACRFCVRRNIVHVFQINDL